MNPMYSQEALFILLTPLASFRSYASDGLILDFDEEIFVLFQIVIRFTYEFHATTAWQFDDTLLQFKVLSQVQVDM